MEVMATYNASVSRDGRFWFIRIDGIGSTQARHLRELDAMAKDLIAVMTGAPGHEIVVQFDIRLPEDVQDHLRRSEELRAASAEAQAAAAAEVRSAARLLHEQGVALRDVGRLLGVSHRRAHQLLS